MPNRLRLTNPERITLAEIGKRLGRKALKNLACVAKPDTILAWYHRLIAQKFDGSEHRQYPGRPPIDKKIDQSVVRMAKENPSWGYDRIVGALANLCHKASDETVGNILRKHGISPAPKRNRTMSWRDFIASHMNVMAGTDFFTVEVLTWRGLVTYYVLFFLHHESRRAHVAGITKHPNEEWMQQMAYTSTQDGWGHLKGCRYVLHDRDSKFCAAFRSAMSSAGVRTIPLPARSPNLNAFAERWVRSVKQECLSKLIIFGPNRLWRVLNEYNAHYHSERNHQGKENLLLFPRGERLESVHRAGSVRCKRRLGGPLKYYERAA